MRLKINVQGAGIKRRQMELTRQLNRPVTQDIRLGKCGVLLAEARPEKEMLKQIP